MKALDGHVKQHKERMGRLEAEKAASEANIAQTVRGELDNAEARHRRELASQAAEEDRRRHEMQEALRMQMEGAESERLQVVQTEHDRKIEDERKAASARLMQSRTSRGKASL